MNASRGRRKAALLTALLAGVGLAAAACGGGAGAAPVNAPPASPHTAAEKKATLNWLAKTNQMWVKDDFAALDQVTTGEMLKKIGYGVFDVAMSFFASHDGCHVFWVCPFLYPF